VRLFTVGESRCPVRRDWLFARPPDPMGTSIEEAAHVLAAYDALADVDVIHDHSVLGPLVAPAHSRHRTPVVSTHHGPFTAVNQRIFAKIAERAAVIAISHDQASRAGRVPVSAVIHHGIDLDAYQFGPGDGGYLLFLGRMSPDKGVHLAVRAAHAAGRPLRLASKIREPAEWEYFERTVRPLLGPNDDLMTEPGFDQQLRLLRHATALLNPICWPEPFGLVMAESLACGTPVVGFASGAAPEIVDDGRTGFLCADEAALVAAVDRVTELDRHACRTAVEERFSMGRMASEHEALYRRVVHRPTRDTEVSACPSRHSHGHLMTSLQRSSPHPMS
jgi:glycosyltransferase involved in cell wall biosynthesis